MSAQTDTERFNAATAPLREMCDQMLPAGWTETRQNGLRTYGGTVEPERIPIPDLLKCPTCNGAGVLELGYENGVAYGDTCPECRGSGQVDDRTAEDLLLWATVPPEEEPYVARCLRCRATLTPDELKYGGGECAKCCHDEPYDDKHDIDWLVEMEGAA